MNPKNTGHRATYDAEGNIIIPPDTAIGHDEGRETLTSERPATQSRVYGATMWTVIEEDGAVVGTSVLEVEQNVAGVGTRIRSAALGTISSALQESAQQYKETGNEARNLLRAMRFAAASPRKPKPRSRLALFAFDTVRFGGTFAAIFVFLFVAINYQSFWKIAKAEFAIGQDLETVQALSSLTQGDLGGKLLRSPSLAVAGEAQEDLLAYLPPVGPPENRLIIPKLGKNVPIVIPPIDSLIIEDWRQFERDIQHSLREGVVHYPGTARPGQAGNFFVTGHSSYYPWDPGKYKDVFARLNELEVGDTYSVYFGGDLHTYRVTDKFEVRPSNVSVLDQPTDRRKATLMTCTPIGTTLRRLIVQAVEIDPVTGKELDVGEHGSERVRLPKIDMLPI